MSEIKINVDLDLSTEKAKEQLDSFKKSTKDEKIPVKLDIDKAKQDAIELKNVLSNAFKLDSNTIGNLKKVEDALKQINKLIKSQSDLTKKGNLNKSDSTFIPFTINKNVDIVKNVSNLVDDYKDAQKQLADLDKVGMSMKEALDNFNRDQEDAFKKFANESKRYNAYLDELEGDNITSTLKKAINARKRSIELQEELTKLGVVKVDNTQLRNEKHDGSIFTIENEKWKAMFAKTESEAKDLENMARKIKPKIDNANKTVSELINQMSDGEKEILDAVSKAYEQRPKFNNLSGFDNDNVSILRMYLESMMPDIDKIGLNFDNYDDIFKGLNRFYSRLEQMQNEYNHKFANQDDFKPMRLDSLLDIEHDQAKKIIQEAEQNNNLLDSVLKDRLNILNKNGSDGLDLGLNDKSLRNMEEFIRLSKLVNQATTRSSSSGNSINKDVRDYIAATKKINELQTQLYKSDANKTSDISKSIQNEIDLMRQKQLAAATAIRANKDLYESVRDQIRIEEQLSNARRNTKETIVDTDSLNKLNKSYQELDKIQDKLKSMQNTKGFLDNSLVEKTNSLLAETRSKLDANGIESDFKEISNSVDLLNRNLKSLSDGNTLGKQEANFNVSLQNMENKVESFINKCKEMGNAEHLIERVEHAFKSINTDNLERANVDLKQMANTLNQAEREARQLSSTMNNTRTFFGNFGQEFKENLFTFTAGELLADGIRNVAHSLSSLVMEYDTAITNLKKVANPADVMNIDQLDAIESKAVSIAKNVGQSSQDVIQAIADTIQMGGYGMEQATQIAEQTMMLANVADLTQEVASKGVVTMMSAFNLDPLKEVSVVVNGVTKSTDELTNAMDILNYTGNQFSISSGGILDAITSGANVLANYGVSMNDTVAMITAANHTLQDTSRVGNGLKTIQTRLAGIKTSAKDGTISLNKTALALKEIAGINVFSNEAKGEIKDMATLIEELGAKWGDFTDEQRAALSEAIAGANQASVFQSLMSNIDVMKEVQNELNQGWHFGSALAENEQYVDSLSGKLNKLKETWVGIFNTVFDSNAAKGILDVLINISEAIANVITTLDELGMLTPVLLGLGAILTSKAFSGIGNIFSVGEKSAKSFMGVLPGITKCFTSMNPPATKFGATLVGMGTKISGAGTAIGGLLGSASSFIPWAVAAGVAVAGVAKAVDYFTESLDEEEQRLNETINTRKEEISSLNEQKGKLKEIQKEYDELANKPNKTSQEVERLKTLTQELAEIKPELVVGYDSDGNPILSMTGDVKDLITEIDRAIESKDRLLTSEKNDSAKNAIKQLHGDMNDGKLDKADDLQMKKLETLTSDHVNNMSKLEAKRDKILNQLYEATGQERQKLLKDLDKANYEIEKAQSEFVNDYQQQLNVIKEYTDKIGDGLFSSIENSSAFKNASEEIQQQFSSLKQHLDFSDIKTEGQLLEAEYALNKLLTAAKNGDVDLEKIKSSLEKANAEFAKTQDAEKYAKSIDDIINTIKEIPGLENINVDILKDMFEGIDTSVTKGKDALDEFLRAYGKTKADLEKNDGFAKALSEQKRQIEDAINNLEITGNPEIDLELGYDIVSNSDLPEQLRDMVRTLLNQGHDSTEVLKFAQKVLIDLSDGEVNIDELQKILDEKFGEGSFEITPEILLNDNSKVAGVERVIEQINERFGEIPPVVKTIIEAEGITAFNEAKRLTEIYLSIPEEIRTTMSNNGLESASDVILINQLLNNLPTSVVTNIVTNFPEVFSNAESIKDVINNLPSSVLMEIKNNYPEVVEKSKILKDAIENIPATKESKISVKEEIKKDPMSLLDRLFGKNKTDMTATAVINSQVNGLDALKDFNSIWSSITGKGNGASGASGKSGRSIDTYDINPLADDISSLARATNQTSTSSGGSGFNATINVSVNGLDAIQQLQDVMNNLVLNDISATITISTSVAAQNLSGLIVRINQTKEALGNLSSKNVNINTAQSAKNLSGLITRVNEYKAAADSAKTATFNAETAQAAKNMSGLIAKINATNSAASSTKPINFKTNATSVANQVKSLASAVRSVPNGKTITYSIKTNGSVPKVSSPRSVFAMEGQGESLASVSSYDATSVDSESLMSARASSSEMLVSANPVASPMLRARITAGNAMDYFNNSVDAFTDIEKALEKIAKQLDFIDKKAELAFGNDKANLLKQQLSLLQKQQTLQSQMSQDLKIYQNELKYFLGQNGVKFGSDGTALNHQEKLLSIAKQIKDLENKSSNSKDDNAKKKYDSQKESLEKVKRALEEYVDINNGKIPGCSAEWWELEKQINNTKVAILEAENALRDFKFEVAIGNMEIGLKKLERQISRLDRQIKKAFGEEKVSLIQNRVSLIQEEQKRLHQLANTYREQAASIGQFLNNQGFIIELDGTLGDLEVQLNRLKDSPIFEYIKDQVEEYLELIGEKIPDASDKWWELNEAIEESIEQIEEAKAEARDFKIELNIKQVEVALKKIEREISRLDREIDKAFGAKKEQLLNNKIEEIKNQQNKLHELANKYREQAKSIGLYLNSLGFNINPDGVIDIGYLEKLQGHPAFNFISDQLDKYIELTQNTIPDLSEEWWDLQGSIESAKDEIEEARKELEKFINEAKIDALLDQFNDLAHRLDIIDKKLKHATGKDKLDLMSEKLEIIKQQQIELQKHWEFFNNQKNTLQMELGQLGFKFDNDGDITNYVEQLEIIANSSSDFEEVKEKLEEYFDLQNNRLPDIESDWLDLENAYKDALKEQLNTTKEIEEKITEIYKKQINDRIDAMNKETDEKVKNLKKQQEAYNKYREEANYKDEYEDKLSNINDIQRQLDIAMRDTSLQGQKKVKELQKLLADAQKELDKFTQNKIDSDINDMFEQESDRITESNKNAIEALEKEWSDSKIAEMVSQAISSGIFEGIDGKISGLQDAMLEFAQETGELFGVMGTVIKSELITNLDIAMNTFRDLENIIKNLNLEKFSTLSNTIKLDLQPTQFAPNMASSNVVLNAPMINIEGNVDKDVFEDLKAYGDRLTKDIINKISSSIR